jgi:hypothetical protein
MGNSFSDYTLVFGTSNDYGPNNVKALDRAAIHVSPQMLKMIWLQIGENLKAFEEVFGEIPIPRMASDSISRIGDQLKIQYNQWNRSS